MLFRVKWEKLVENLMKSMEWSRGWAQEEKRSNFSGDQITACRVGLLLAINSQISELRTLKLLKDIERLTPWLILTRWGWSEIWRKCPPPIIFIRFTTTIYKRILAETGDRSPIFNLYPPLSPPIPLFWNHDIKLQKNTLRFGEVLSFLELKSVGLSSFPMVVSRLPFT